MPDYIWSNRKILSIALILTFIVCVFITSLMRNYQLDDALIYYRYISNCMEGDGLVYNKGERFNALTSPLYTYLSLAAVFIIRDIQGVQVLLGCIFLFLSCVMIAILFRDKVNNFILGMGLLLIVSNIYFYCTFGLETTFFLFLIVLAIWLYIEEKYFALGIVSCLIFLTRGESIFLVLTLIIMHFIDKRRFPSIKVFIIPLILLGAHFLFNYSYYGSFLPNSFMTKIYQGRSGLFGKWPLIITNAGGLFKWFFKGDVLLLSLLIVVSIIGLLSNLKSKIIHIFLIFLVLYTAFYVFLNLPNYHWYYALYFLMGYILFSLGLNWIYSAVSKWNMKKGQIVGIFLISIIFSYIFIKQLAYSYEWRGSSSNKDYREIGIWLKNNTEEEAKVACIEIGHIGWYSKRYIVDILGLVNPYNAKLLGERKWGDWFKYYKPDYILIHDPIWIQEIGLKDMIGNNVYKKVDKFCFKGFILLGIQRGNIESTL